MISFTAKNLSGEVFPLSYDGSLSKKKGVPFLRSLLSETFGVPAERADVIWFIDEKAFAIPKADDQMDVLFRERYFIDISVVYKGDESFQMRLEIRKPIHEEQVRKMVEQTTRLYADLLEGPYSRREWESDFVARVQHDFREGLAEIVSHPAVHLWIDSHDPNDVSLEDFLYDSKLPEEAEIKIKMGSGEPFLLEMDYQMVTEMGDTFQKLFGDDTPVKDALQHADLLLP